MGLFDKKYCDICGKKIGLLGNRKLEDGNLCKDCAKKLSPWFSDRKRSTVQEIKEQLAYREANKAVVDAFNVTRALGDRTTVLLDEDSKKFIVTSSRNWRDENPDVLDFSMVTGCDLDIDETRTELKRKDAEGKEISYDPPRYEYNYDFEMVIRVNHPYFSEMRFPLNSESVLFQPDMPRGLIDRPVNSNPRMMPEYQRYEKMGNEIKEILMTERQHVRDTVIAESAPKKSVTCPWCGAMTFPDEKGCCTYCGGSLNA